MTVIVPAFNAARFVGDAIESVRASTYPDWSCIVVDDGSFDDTAATAISAMAGDPRFRLVRQPNGGHVAAINRACEEVDGDVVALLDSDDMFLADKLHVVIERLRDRPAAGLATHRLFVADDKLRIVGLMPLADRLPDGDLRSNLRRSASGDPGLGVTSGMVLRREIFDLVFPADPQVGPFSDELVRRIAPMASEVVSCDSPLGVRRTHGANQSDKAASDLKGYMRASITSYEHVRRAQERAAADLGFPLPVDDLDLALNAAVLAHLDGAADASARRRQVTDSTAFAQVSGARRLFWHVVLRLPRRLFAPAVEQLYGVTNAKLLLNWRALRRLQRRGVVVELPGPALGARPLAGKVLRGLLPRALRQAAP